MKIDGTVKPAANGAMTGSRAHANPNPAPGPRSEGARVELSSLSARLHVIESGLDDAQVVDTARVAEIKQAISEGRFRVNAERVADRLLDTVRELITSHKA